MTEAGWTRETDFAEVARKLVLKINEIQPDQWDQYDDKDHARITLALKAAYQQGRVAAFKEVEQRFDSMFGATDRRIDSVRDYRIDKFFTWLAQAAQAAQDEKGARDAS